MSLFIDMMAGLNQGLKNYGEFQKAEGLEKERLTDRQAAEAKAKADEDFRRKQLALTERQVVASERSTDSEIKNRDAQTLVIPKKQELDEKALKQQGDIANKNLEITQGKYESDAAFEDRKLKIIEANAAWEKEMRDLTKPRLLATEKFSLNQLKENSDNWTNSKKHRADMFKLGNTIEINKATEESMNPVENFVRRHKEALPGVEIPQGVLDKLSARYITGDVAMAYSVSEANRKRSLLGNSNSSLGVPIDDFTDAMKRVTEVAEKKMKIMKEASELDPKDPMTAGILKTVKESLEKLDAFESAAKSQLDRQNLKGAESSADDAFTIYSQVHANIQDYRKTKKEVDDLGKSPDQAKKDKAKEIEDAKKKADETRGINEDPRNKYDLMKNEEDKKISSEKTKKEWTENPTNEDKRTFFGRYTPPGQVSSEILNDIEQSIINELPKDEGAKKFGDGSRARAELIKDTVLLTAHSLKDKSKVTQLDISASVRDSLDQLQARKPVEKPELLKPGVIQGDRNIESWSVYALKEAYKKLGYKPNWYSMGYEDMVRKAKKLPFVTKESLQELAIATVKEQSTKKR